MESIHVINGITVSFLFEDEYKIGKVFINAEPVFVLNFMENTRNILKPRAFFDAHKIRLVKNPKNSVEVKCDVLLIFESDNSVTIFTPGKGIKVYRSIDF